MDSAVVECFLGWMIELGRNAVQHWQVVALVVEQ